MLFRVTTTMPPLDHGNVYFANEGVLKANDMRLNNVFESDSCAFIIYSGKIACLLNSERICTRNIFDVFRVKHEVEII